MILIQIVTASIAIAVFCEVLMLRVASGILPATFFFLFRLLTLFFV